MYLPGPTFGSIRGQLRQGGIATAL